MHRAVLDRDHAVELGEFQRGLPGDLDCDTTGPVVNHDRQVDAVRDRRKERDDFAFWPVLEAAESLDAPIYLHPTQPPKPVIEASFGGFAPLVIEMLAGPGFGWHIETAVHVLRMVLGGVFDRFPKLQIVIGHMGEGLPFFMQRVDVMPVELTQLKRPVSAYLRENLHYTFAGFNFTPTPCADRAW